MVFSQSKDGINRILVYQNSVLMIDKQDSLTFAVDNEHLKYNFKFTFSTEGEKFTTVIWENKEEGYLHYQLNNWDYSTWVEISRPIIINLPYLDGMVWMKFRTQANEQNSYRQFDISIWKEVKGDK
jgi:hypothetical protein